VEAHKNKSVKSYNIPVVVFIIKSDETGFFYSQKQIQTTVAGGDFHRRRDVYDTTGNILIDYTLFGFENSV
jgi:hypothetical protein